MDACVGFLFFPPPLDLHSSSCGTEQDTVQLSCALMYVRSCPDKKVEVASELRDSRRLSWEVCAPQISQRCRKIREKRITRFSLSD